MGWNEWQRSWDKQQTAFMPDREARFDAMLEVVETLCGPKPRVLDLACGTGSISLRLLERLPGASSVGLDLDPSLLRIAQGTFDGDERVRVVRADLRTPSWAETAGTGFDAVLTATALHWLPEQRLRELYAEIVGVLRPGGVFCNADHMADPGLPTLTEKLHQQRAVRREEVIANTDALSWVDWWNAARNAPELADAVAERDTIFGGPGGLGGRSPEKNSTPHDGGSMPSCPTHLKFLTEAGFSEVGLIWRGMVDAAFAAIR